MELKERIEQLLSEILSDKYECKITLHFEQCEPKRRKEERKRPCMTQREEKSERAMI